MPTAVLGFGLAGLIPFLAPPMAALLLPDQATWWHGVAAGYAAVILSFLGGARWGAEVQRPAPRFGVVAGAMLPSIVAWTLLLLPASLRGLQLALLAAGLVLHWAWDIAAHADLPPWYGRLRSLLTVGAVTGLGVQALLAS